MKMNKKVLLAAITTATLATPMIADELTQDHLREESSELIQQSSLEDVQDGLENDLAGCFVSKGCVMTSCGISIFG